MSGFFLFLADLVHFVLTLYIYIIIARAVISWISVNPYNTFVQWIYRLTEPVLGFVRQFLPAFGGLDLSPVIVIFAIVFLDRILVSLLIQLAR